jgi:hypothetical protein
MAQVMAKHVSHILDMARKGAAHRSDELKDEIATLVTKFKHLAAHSRDSVEGPLVHPSHDFDGGTGDRFAGCRHGDGLIGAMSRLGD